MATFTGCGGVSVTPFEMRAVLHQRQQLGFPDARKRIWTSPRESVVLLAKALTNEIVRAEHGSS